MSDDDSLLENAAALLPVPRNFAPLIAFKETHTAGNVTTVRVAAALGVEWTPGPAQTLAWQLRRYDGDGSTLPPDFYYGWWETVAAPGSSPGSDTSLLSGFSEIALTNSSCAAQADLPHGAALRQHVFFPCGMRAVVMVSQGVYQLRFSLRSACGLPRGAVKDGAPLYEIPFVLETGILPSGKPVLKEVYGGLFNGNNIEWTRNAPVDPVRFVRDAIAGSAFKVLNGKLKIQHGTDTGSGSDGQFWWRPDDVSPPDRSRGSVYTTFIAEHPISWSSDPQHGPGSELLAVRQTPLTDSSGGDRVLTEKTFASLPSWKIEVLCQDSRQLGDFVEARWADWSQPYLASVKSGLTADSLSFLPELSGVTRRADGAAVFECTDAGGSAEASLTFKIHDPTPSREYEATARFTAVYGEHDDHGNGDGSCGVLTAKLRFRVLPRDLGGQADLELFLVGAITVDGQRADSALYFRDNALEWGMHTGQWNVTNGVPRLRAGWRQIHSCQAGGAGGRRVFVSITGLALPVLNVTPIAQDATPELRVSSVSDYEASDFRADPLVIPHFKPVAASSTPPPAPPAKYVLNISESVRPPRSRNLVLELAVEPNTTPSLGDRIIVLDPHPFTVAAIPLDDFNFLDDAASGRILARRVYDSETGAPVWRLVVNTADVNRALVVRFPPQAVGEQALLLQKTPIFKPDGTPDPTQDPFYDVRLGANGVVGLETSYFDERYAPVPWDLRWILGRPGERDTGARIRWLDVELLYGLMAHFDADPQQPAIRLAETASRLGDWPGGLPETLPWPNSGKQNDAFVTLRGAWSDLARRYVARLGLYELWSQAQTEGVVLRDGLTIRPRVAPSGTPFQPKGAQLAKLPGIDYTAPALPPEIGNQYALDGLAGGFEWGMQEWGTPWIRAFWTVAKWPDGRSSSAQLDGLGFSALGGRGHQVARFLKDRIIIEASVTEGRAHVYSVERIGRIGVFWNKAKHVIRYERSTVPAPEFINNVNPGDNQTPELGRPILRKVDEYIEILEDRRPYPDRPGAEPIHTGPIAACVFPRVGYQIRIRHSWGRSLDSDTGTPPPTGRWEVPLWQPGSNPERFPKPEIHLEIYTRRASTPDQSATNPADGDAPGGQDALSTFFQAIKHPEDVYFYTDGDVNLPGDPGDWPAVPEVDLTDSFEPLEDWTLPNGVDPATAQFPDALDVAPGMKRFSFRLEPAQDETVVTANRQASAQIRGRARSVTMMRSMPKLVAERPAFTDAKAAAAQATEKQLGMTRGMVAFGLTKTMNRLRAGQKPTAAEIVAEIKSQLDGSQAKPPENFQFFDPGAPQDLCGVQNVNNPLLYRLLSAAVGQLDAQARQFVRVRIDTAVAVVKKALDEAPSAVSGLQAAAVDTLDQQINLLKLLEPHFSTGFEGLLRAFCEQLDHALDDARAQIDLVFDGFEKFLGQTEAGVEEFAKDANDAATRVESIRDRLDTALTVLRDQLESLATKLDAAAASPFSASRNAVAVELRELRDAVGDRTVADSVAKTMYDALTTAAGALRGAGNLTAGFVRDQTATLRAVATGVRNRLVALLADAVEEMHRQAVSGLGATLQQALAALQAGIEDLFKKGIGLLETCETYVKNHPLDGDVRGAITTLDNALDDWKNHAVTGVDAVIKSLLTQNVCPLVADLCSLNLGLGGCFGQGFWDAVNSAADIQNNVNRLAAAAGSGDVDAAINEAEALANRVNKRFGYYTEQALGEVKNAYAAVKTGEQVVQDANDILRSARAVADAFTTPGLGFNRKTVALLYQTGDAIRKIQTTPIISRLKELDGQLGALGVHLPVKELVDRFLPDIGSFPNFDFNQILKDLGGINLTGLFSGFKMPDALGEVLKVTHGVDKESMRAWVKADLPPYELGDDMTVFSLGPVRVRVENPTLEAHVSMSMDIDRHTQKDARGSLSATWILDAGSELVAFEDTVLSFENGQMHFRIEPQKVRLSGLLQMLSDAANTINAQDDGFSVGLVKVGEIPAGMKAVLELPPISAGSTPVAVDDLQLGGFLELRALDDDLKFNFTLGVGLHLSRKESPFSVAIFCLGGGGWVDATVRYTGSKGFLEADLGVGLNVSASLDINFCVVSGYIRASLGIFCEYHRHAGSSSQLLVGVMLLLEGQVDVLGIVEVYLALMLEGTYDGHSLVGTGRLTLRIKICWCFTLKVEKSVTYRFGGGGGSSTKTLSAHASVAAAALAASVGGAPALAPAAFATADPAQQASYLQFARDYVAMLE